MNRTIGLVKL